MKVFTDSIELLGKHPYKDSRLEKLKERFSPERVTFYTIEFINEKIELAQCLLVNKEKLLDYIVEDMEKCESLLEKTENAEILKKVLDILNSEKPVSDVLVSTELEAVRNYSFLTAKPVVIWQEKDFSLICEDIFKKTNSIFFFTTVKKEVRAWLIPQGTDIVTAASKIHTDLAKGFIRAEVYNIKDLDSFHNLEEAKQRGLLKVVDKTYVVQDGDMVDIKFSVQK